MADLSTKIAGKHVPELDGLRGIAVLMVMLYHLRKLVHFELPGHLLSYGWSGVDLFFVLSGFLITGILLDSKDNPHYFRNFYARRILRIWPLYFVLLALVYLVAPAVNPHIQSTLAQYSPWCYVFFVQNLVFWEGGFYLLIPTWSLAIEEQFYVAWPLIVRLTSTKLLKRISLALLVSAPIVRAVLSSRGFPIEAIYHGTLTHIDGIAVGALLAALMREPGINGFRRAALPVGAASIAAFVGLAVIKGEAVDNSPLAYTCVSIAFGALLTAAVSPVGSRSPYQQFLRSSWLRYTGKISYALYLSHSTLYPMFNGARAHRALPRLSNPWFDDAFVAIVCLGASYLVSTFSWYVLEAPILRLKSYFEEQKAISVATRDGLVQSSLRTAASQGSAE